eukprot:gnl/TRDRNA2_/TRDRNA2_178013_c0_seq1.p1 gnl/TRDRNA2_/TRDRNA2_178013_c0~~gnl/TRDRNA2_/TRDRNA2_178013_c0_seq1.p1  ORF type:complete len:808 (-),score=-4.39 gnl/TRDRNA2_/TRDRNA2_178013_c0_seq1:668-3091(-)
MIKFFSPLHISLYRTMLKLPKKIVFKSANENNEKKPLNVDQEHKSIPFYRIVENTGKVFSTNKTKSSLMIENFNTNVVNLSDAELSRIAVYIEGDIKEMVENGINLIRLQLVLSETGEVILTALALILEESTIIRLLREKNYISQNSCERGTIKTKKSKQNISSSSINLFKFSDSSTIRKKTRLYTSSEYKFTAWYDMEKKIYTKLERNTTKVSSEKFITDSLTEGKNILEGSEKEVEEIRKKNYPDLTENKSQFKEKTKPYDIKKSNKSMNNQISYRVSRHKLKKKKNEFNTQIRKRSSLKPKSIDSEESLEKLNSKNLGFSLWKDEKAYENWLKTYGLDDATLALDYSTKSLDPKGMELIQKEEHIYSRGTTASSSCNSSGEPAVLCIGFKPDEIVHIRVSLDAIAGYMIKVIPCAEEKLKLKLKEVLKENETNWNNPPQEYKSNFNERHFLISGMTEKAKILVRGLLEHLRFPSIRITDVTECDPNTPIIAILHDKTKYYPHYDKNNISKLMTEKKQIEASFMPVLKYNNSNLTSNVSLTNPLQKFDLSSSTEIKNIYSSTYIRHLINLKSPSVIRSIDHILHLNPKSKNMYRKTNKFYFIKNRLISEVESFILQVLKAEKKKTENLSNLALHSNSTSKNLYIKSYNNSKIPFKKLTNLWKDYVTPPSGKIMTVKKDLKYDVFYAPHSRTTEAKNALISNFKELLLDALEISSSNVEVTTGLEEIIVENNAIHPTSKRFENIFTLRYDDPEINPFRFIFNGDYDPDDFIKDAIESVLAIGYDYRVLKATVDKSQKKNAIVCSSY